MASSSSPPSSPLYSSSRNWKYDVFPSFCGPDVRKTFLSHLWTAFNTKGINTFVDNEIKRSMSIETAIRESRIAIVILSRNYTSSSWCLDELVEIMNCREELGQVVLPVFYEVDPGQVVLPVFYEVDPTDVKRQTGEFGKLLRNTCKPKDVIERWRQALADVATIKGYHSHSWDGEASLIKEIATNISNILIYSTHSKDLDGLLGMGTHLEMMESLLCPHSDEVKMIGIWVPSGIGKTTIAKSLYQQFANKFQFSTIMLNIKGFNASTCQNEHNAKLQLQTQLLSQLTNQKVTDDISHLGVAHEILKHKRVLVVIDDLEDLGQLDTLAKELQWFGPGSRIIITSKDARLSKAHGINHIYKVGFPAPDEALQIFLCDEDKELSHHHVSCLHDGELAKGFSEVRQELITNQDLKGDLDTSERACKRISSRLLHTVYIYCEDTLQYSFASHLSMDFRRKGIYASVNCNETLDVIEGARASVVVFSKNYLFSTSCLDKLVRVLQCWRKNGQLVVVPVFYGVSPSDVVVPEHKSADRIREWSSELQELRELPGHQFRERFNECELVEEIVKDVYKKLFPAENIGIDSKLLDIEHLLRKQTWGVRRIGIWGMPGIGKTTLARAFFDQYSGGYEASCFIQQFDKAFHEKGIHRLLGEYFGNILKDLPRACSSITRPSLPRDRLRKKRTLVVLDDVYNPLVAESFLRGLHWFGPGSLIIITSRDKQVFRFCQINHVYEVQSLNKNEALQLFSQCAFGQDIGEQNLPKLSKEVIDYANGNPFALSFYGGELKRRRLSETETTFLKLKRRRLSETETKFLKLHTSYEIYNIFKSSYESLNGNEKNIFLDITCFFKGENVDYVMQLLEGCGFFPHVGIDVLVDKCLLTISENRVEMHRIIQDLGRKIINKETKQIERRSRLWEPRTIKFLLEDDKLEANKDPKATYTRALGTEDIEGIFLDASKLLFDVKPTAFENMLNLRFLKIDCSNNDNLYGLRLPKGLESLPYELRLLHWDNYPLQYLPEDFEPCHLIELNMSYSQLEKLWEGTKNLEMLKMLRICHSQELTEIDEICRARNIELIDLQGCTKLQTFPASGQLEHLRVVNLSNCTQIKSFPEVSPNIEELHLQRTGISELPISIGNAINLKILDMSHCSSLLELPSSIGNATNLQKLYLKYCSSLVKLPSSIGNAINLKELNLSHCSSLVELPSSIRNATHFQKLNLDYCSSLEKVPSSN
ncbi:Disease resistance protein RRS1B [Cardamine amara subsp. amara]|uniref:Disease resistance protein RRS1B n=1 Tax=Cardamine amara subsp. amara TaxID=228776 RepID=A0ABD1BFV4_CARAN